MARRQAIAYVCVSLAAMAVVGCGSSAPHVPAVVATTAPAPAAAVSSAATLTLAEIQPPATLPPTTGPSTQPVKRAPVEAVTLYARAVDALRTGRRFAAISLLQDAIKLDPQSFELHHAIG